MLRENPAEPCGQLPMPSRTWVHWRELHAQADVGLPASVQSEIHFSESLRACCMPGSKRGSPYRRPSRSSAFLDRWHVQQIPRDTHERSCLLEPLQRTGCSTRVESCTSPRRAQRIRRSPPSLPNACCCGCLRPPLRRYFRPRQWRPTCRPIVGPSEPPEVSLRAWGRTSPRLRRLGMEPCLAGSRLQRARFRSK